MTRRQILLTGVAMTLRLLPKMPPVVLPLQKTDGTTVVFRWDYQPDYTWYAWSRHPSISAP